MKLYVFYDGRKESIAALKKLYRSNEVLYARNEQPIKIQIEEMLSCDMGVVLLSPNVLKKKDEVIKLATAYFIDFPFVFVSV